jgi:hypothetical protein
MSIIMQYVEGEAGVDAAPIILVSASIGLAEPLAAPT